MVFVEAGPQPFVAVRKHEQLSGSFEALLARSRFFFAVWHAGNSYGTNEVVVVVLEVVAVLVAHTV